MVSAGERSAEGEETVSKTVGIPEGTEWGWIARHGEFSIIEKGKISSHLGGKGRGRLIRTRVICSEYKGSGSARCWWGKERKILDTFLRGKAWT